MASLPPPERASYLINLLDEHGQGDYIGESINQLEHSLQAAHQAQKSGMSTAAHRLSKKNHKRQT
jgi:predicted HD phosphohydrolase